MTIPVPFEQLASTLTAFDHAYLITMRGQDEFAKILTVDPFVRGDRLIVATERDSVRSNVAADQRVTLIWPNREYHGFSLIVDGLGTVVDGEIVIDVDHGMLHRPSEHDDGPEWVFPA